MRYFVTGGQGFVGRYAIAEILRQAERAEVYATGRSRLLPDAFSHDLTRNGRRVPAPLPRELCVSRDRVTYESADVTDQAAIDRVTATAQPDVVLHLASGLRGDDAESLLRTNVLGTTSLLRAIAKCGSKVKMIVIGSSGSVYGNLPTDALPSDETRTAVPADTYAVTKLAQEHIARVTAAQYDLPIAFARIFNVVGPGQDERHVCGRFAAVVSAIAAGKLPRQIFVGDLDAVRDFVDVRDVASGLLAIARDGARGGIYNVASGQETRIRTVLDGLFEAAHLEGVRVVEKDIAKSSETRQAANIDAICSLGFTPRYDLKRSLTDLFVYYRDIVNG